MRAALGIVLLMGVGCTRTEAVEPTATAVEPTKQVEPVDEPTADPEPESPTEPEPDKPVGGSDFERALAAATGNDLESLEAVFAAFEAAAEKDPESTAQNWPKLLDMLDEVFDDLSENYGPHVDYLSCKLDPEMCDEQFLKGISDADKKTAERLAALGFGAEYAGEGTYDLGIDWDAMRKQRRLDERLSAADLDYLEYRRWHAGVMFFDDEVIGIEEKELREGIVIMEGFLGRHPDSAHAKDVQNVFDGAAGLYLELCFHFDFDANDNQPTCKLKKKMAKGYRTLVKKQPKSKLVPALKDLLATADAGKAITRKQVTALQKKHGFEASFSF